MVSKKNLDEISKEFFGKEHGRVSKSEYCEMLVKLMMKLQDMQKVVYWRDLLYNPCHESERLNKA